MENVQSWIIVHHTDDASITPQFDKVNAYHQTKFDWPSSLGWYVAYHRFIERDGTIRIARLDTEGGPHTLGYNYAGLAVCLAGNFDIETPTTAQISALCSVMDEWCKLYNLGLDKIKPHRFFRPTSCYGLMLSDDWARNQYALSKLSWIKAALLKILALLKWQ